MIGLLVKDLLNLKQNLKTYLIMLIFYIILSITSKNPSMFGGMVTLVSAMMPITAMSFDERSKWDGYALTMPLSRKSLVLNKYLLCFIFVLTAFVLTALFNSFFTEMSLEENILTNFGVLSVGILYMSVILPILFKWGVEKGRILMMLVLVAPVGIMLLLINSGIAIPELNETIIKTGFYFLIAISLIVFVISYFISLSIYKKKEF